MLAGCSKSLPDTYQEGSDYQYMERHAFSAYHQTGEKAHYFAYGHYIYYMDKEEKVLLPLCGKADCLHDRETDFEKIQGCNAYMETESVDTGISYCNGDLYYVEKITGGKDALYRISADGTKKEQVYQWGKDINVEEWMIHRDVLYYAEHMYLPEKDGTAERYALKALSLSGHVKNPEAIYTVDGNMNVMTVGDLQAYGNFLYFQVHAYEKSEEEITDDNYLKYQYLKTFIYNMKKGEVSELTLPDTEKDDIIQGVVFWQGRILVGPYNPHVGYMKPVPWYIADLDGSNAEMFMEDVGQGLMFHSDGKYLYLSNINMVWRGYDKSEECYKIYNKDLNLVDTVKLPFKPPFGDVSVGTSESMYLNYEKTKSGKKEEDGGEEKMEKDEWGVMYWDKGNIGSYHGDAFEMTHIKYEG